MHPTLVDMLSRAPVAEARRKPKKMSEGHLTAAARQHMPRSEFALPGKGEGPKGAGAGSYPIPDRAHARNALARVAQHGSAQEKATVRAAVHRKFPDIGETGEKKKRKGLYSEESRRKMKD